MRLILTLTAVAAAATAQAQAAETYGKVFGGAVLGTGHDASVTFPGVGSGAGQFDTDLGYSVGGALGYSPSRFLSLEGEIAYRANEINGAVAGVPLGGDDINSLSFMANGVLSAPDAAGLTPYAGAGAGTTRIGALGDHDFVFAYQAFGGVKKDLGANTSAAVEYRYFDADRATLNNPLGALRTEYDAHSVNLVLSHKF